MKNNLQQSSHDSQLSLSVPSGYKQTEVGVIPEDWGVSDIGSISLVPIQNGLFFEPSKKNRGVRLVNVGDMYAAPPISIDALDLFDATASQIKTFRAQEGDIFFTRSSIVPSGIAYCNILPNCNESTVVFDSHLIRVRANPSIVDSHYLYLNCAAKHSRKHLVASAKTATMTTIDQGALKKCPVLVPPLPEQRAIAKALSDMDALLEGLDRLIAKKRDLKQATMQALLTPPAKRVESGKLKVESDGSANSQLSSLKSPLKNVRLPGFEGEWEVKQLGDVGVFLKGSGIRKDDAQSGDLPCVRYGEIYTHHNDYVRYYNSWISRTVAVNAVLLKRGDILFAGSGETKGEIGKCVAFVDDCEAYAGGDIVILRSYETDPVFMGYYCNTVSIRRQKASKGQGDAVVHISASALASIELKLPTIPEQVAIAAVLTDMDTEIEALEQRRDKTADIKQAMMQELLTGKIRLVSGKLKVESGE